VVPRAFWYFSIGGGATLLLYALYRRDPVFILGQAAGLFVYARNLYFVLRDPSTRRRDRVLKCARQLRIPSSHTPQGATTSDD
jgi:lipid-A-disaccharide synthase-like uncharacterized protein